MRPEGPVRVLIIDDSSPFRRTLAAALDAAPSVHALGCAGSVDQVREQLLQYHPEVIVLELQLHRTDALVLLRRLQMHYPVPVLALVSPGGRGHDRAVKAAEVGAFEVIEKPRSLKPLDVQSFAQLLTRRIHVALQIAQPATRRAAFGRTPGSFRAAGLDPSRHVVVIGASTGGTEAITVLLRHVPADFPPTVIVQHMPTGFTHSFAERLNGLCPLKVSEAVDGQRVGVGHAVLARGDTHLVVRAATNGIVARYTDQTPVNRHCPSVDVLFESAAAFGRQGIGVLLTGMGADGANGLLRMHRAGCLTIAQNEASCVVYGMPKAAVDLGAVRHSAPPREIPGLIQQVLRQAGTGTPAMSTER